MLILPFANLRDDRSVDWLREGSVSMLALNLSQWNDLTVVDHERLHDLLGPPPAQDRRRDRARPGPAAGPRCRRLDGRPRRLHAGGGLAPPRGPDVRRGERREGGRSPGGRSRRRRRAAPLRRSGRQAARPLRRARSRSGSAWRGPRPARSRRTDPISTGVELLNRWDLTAAERDFRRATSSTPPSGSPTTGSRSREGGSSGSATRSRTTPLPGRRHTPSVCRSTIAP